MKKYSIKVNNNELQNAINNCNDKIIDILDFFNIDDLEAEIKVLDYESFKNEYKTYLEEDINLDTTGFIEDDKNQVILLDYNDFKYTNHINDTYDDYIKIAIHELVHVIHSIACNHNYPNNELWEGIAVYLSNQYDFEREGKGSYYEYGLKIYNYLKMNTKESLLDILNVNRKRHI